jgi:RIO kinase 1
MKTPRSLEPLVRDGIVDEVLRPLKSGKEAAVYVVLCDGAIRCAKVYKEANQRGFHKQALYREGRKVRNSRQARAMQRGTRFGREQQEEVWRNVEVDALYRLAAAGVRVPRPYNYVEGVLLMELVTDEHGNAAPRLNDLDLTGAQALEYHDRLIKDVVRMLCGGLIHGDLSEFNILVIRRARSLSICPRRLTRRPTIMPPGCWSGMSAISPPTLVVSPPNCLPPVTARRSGTSTRAAI